MDFHLALDTLIGWVAAAVAAVVAVIKYTYHKIIARVVKVEEALDSRVTKADHKDDFSKVYNAIESVKNDIATSNLAMRESNNAVNARLDNIVALLLSRRNDE